MTGGALTNEEALAWKGIADAVEARTASAPIAAAADWERLAAYAAPLAAIDLADMVVVIGDQEPADRAGTIDLRIRQARRDGAHLAIAGPGGTSLESDAGTFLRTLPGAGSSFLAALTAAVVEAGGEHVRTDAPTAGDVAALAATAGADTAHVRALAALLVAAQRPVLIVTDAVDTADIECLAWALGLDHGGGGVLPLPVGANERGERAVGLTGGWDEILVALESGAVKAVVLVGCDPTIDSTAGDRWQMALAQTPVVASAAAFTNGVTSQSQIVLPLDVEHERSGTVINLEGRVQRVRPSLEAISNVPMLEWTGRLAGLLETVTPATVARAFTALAADNPAFGGLSWSTLGDRAELHVARPAASVPAAAGSVAPPAAPPEGSFRLIAPRPLFSGVAVERTPSLAHQRAPFVVLAHDDAQRLGIKRGAMVVVSHAAGEHVGAARISRRLLPGCVRINWRASAATGTHAVVGAQ